jgi:hypothetical protein
MTGARQFSTLPASFALAAGAMLAAAPAASQGGLDNLATVAIMHGTCERLVVRGADHSRGCDGRIINSAHTDGRSGFAFIDSGAVLSFAGQDSAAVGDRATLHVDQVLVSRTDSGKPPTPENIPASGTCEYTNPYAGVSTITCAATTGQGAFGAAFRSDGRPPDVTRFPH